MESNVQEPTLTDPTPPQDNAIAKYTAALQDDPGPKSKPKAKAATPSIDDYVKALNSDEAPVPPTLGGIIGEKDPSQYNFQMKPGLDNDLLRAQNQSWYAQLGLGLANAVPNIATDIVKSMGQLGTLMQFGDDRTYANALTDTMDKWQNPFGEIYQEHPDQTFDIHDPAWWIKQGMGLVEMTGQFAALGGGVGGLLEKGALEAADLLGGGARLTKAFLGTGQVATSAALSYTIGAQMGANVFKQAYATNYARLLSQGQSQDQAHEGAQHIAAQAAASTVQLNTALGFGLNLTSVLPAFKQADDVLDFFRTGQGARAEGESLVDYKTRLQGLGADDATVRAATGDTSGWQHRLSEGLKQSAEGVVMHFSEQSGKRIGDSGKTKGFFEQFDELGHLLDDATSGQGILNVILGVAGGVLNTAVLEKLPLHSDYVRQNNEPVPVMNDDGSPKTDSEGQPMYQTKMYSSREMAKNQRTAYFDSARQAIVTDIDHISSKMDQLQALAKDGKISEIQPVLNDLLATQQLHSITMGTGDNLIAQYQEIAQTDNHTDLGEKAKEQADTIAKQQQTLLQQAGVEDQGNSYDPMKIREMREQLPEDVREQYDQLEQQRKQLLVQSQSLASKSEAMIKGFTTSMKDNSYKERAAQASQDITTYQKWHQENIRTFGGDPRYLEAHVPEIVLHKQIQNHLFTRLITKLDGENTTERTNLEAQHGPVLSTDNFNSIVRDYNRKVAQNSSLGTHFNDELAKLHEVVKANNRPVLEDMLARYKVDYASGDISTAARELSHKLADIRDSKLEQAKQAHTNIGESLEFKDWSDKNPGKSLADYIGELSKRTIQNQALSAKEEYTEQLRAEQSILRDQIAKITSKPKEYAKSVVKDYEKAQARATEKMKAENNTFVNKDREKTAADNISNEQKRQQSKVYQQKITDTQAEIDSKTSQLKEATGAEMKTKLGKLISWTRDPQERKLRTEIANLQAQADFFRDKLSKVLLPPDTPEETISENELTSLPGDIEKLILEMAGANSSQMTPDGIRTWVKDFLGNRGIDIATITPDSIDALIVRALGANKQGVEKDSSETVDRLNDLISQTGMPSLVREAVDEILNGEKSFSYDALAMHQAMDFVDQPTATKIMQAVSDLINSANVAEDSNTTTPDTPIETPDPPDNEDETPPDGDIGDPEPPDPPLPTPDGASDQAVVGRNTQKDAKPMFHLGAKATDALKINRLDVAYTTDITDIGDSGDYKLKSITSQLNKVLGEQMLSFGKVVPGTEVTLQVDTNWDGRKNVDSQANTTTADYIGLYLDKDGKVPNAQNLIDEVPIRVVINGQTEGYLPRVGWVLAKNEGATNYRNIAPTDADPNNPETQAERLRAVRSHIVSFFNSGSKDVKTVIQERGPAHLIMNVDEKGRIEPSSALKMLPEPKLELGVVDYGNVKTGKVTTSTKKLNIAQSDSDWMTQGAPVAVVPMPDGKYSTAPLFNRSIEQHEIKTMLEAVRAYLANDSNTISKLKELTDFDISNASELRNFINQHYTYTNRFSLATLQPSLDPAAVPKFLFNITNDAGDQRAEISVGTSYSGRDRMLASLQGNKLHPEFVRQFTEGMQSRYKNIVFDDPQRNIKGLNNPSKLTEVVFSNGVIKARKEHTSYNDYVKSFSDTPVNGTNQLSTGERVYGVHSNTTIDMDKVMSTRPDRRIRAKLPDASVDITPEPTTPKTTKRAKFSQEDANLLDEGFMDQMPSFSTPGLTLESLQELHTFTPDSEHNGKSPYEVLAELKKLGLDHIPPDFNPFTKC